MSDPTSSDGPFTPARCRWMLWGMALFALAVRLWTLDYALPFAQEPDPHILDQIETLSREQVSEREIFFSSIYPHLLARSAMLLGPVTGAPAGVESFSLEQHLDAAGRLHRHVRLAIALFSLLTIPGTWWIARAFVERHWALFAAALAATSTLALQFGHQARPHAAVAGLIAITIAAALRLRRDPSLTSFVLAGGAAALAVGSLQNAAVALLACMAAFLLRERVSGLRRFFDARLLIPIALIALSVRVFWPFLFVEAPPDAAASSGAPQVEPALGPLLAVLGALSALTLGVLGAVVERMAPKRSRKLAWGSLALALLGAACVYLQGDRIVYVGWQTIDLREFHGAGFPTLGMTLWYYEPVSLALALAGLVTWSVARERSRERFADLVVVASFALVYALVIGLVRRNQQRFALPLIPFVSVLAAYGARGIARWLRAEVARHVLVALALLVPTAACVAYTRIRSRPQTLELLARWIETHVERGRQSVAMHLVYDVPLARERDNLFDANGTLRAVIFSPWLRYQSQWLDAAWKGERWDIEALYPERAKWPAIAKDPAPLVEQLDAAYVVLPGGDGVGVTALTQAVRGEIVRVGGEKVLELPDETRPPTSGLEGLDTPHFTYYVLTAEWFGPQLEVYSLPPRDQRRR